MASTSLARWPVIDGAALGPQIASKMPAGSQRHYRHRHVFTAMSSFTAANPCRA
jgi:hypothetical protein